MRGIAIAKREAEQGVSNNFLAEFRKRLATRCRNRFGRRYSIFWHNRIGTFEHDKESRYSRIDNVKKTGKASYV